MELLVSLTILIFSAILHEIAHGYVADRLGDPTARLLGRLTLDPRKHIDPMLTVMVPLLLLLSGSPVLFGGAKPVPIDPFNLKDGKKDLAIVSLAGPLTNVIIALIGTALLRLLFLTPMLFNSNSISYYVFDFLQFFLIQTITINLLLAIFNLLPIPPLDGSKIFAMLLPDREARTYLSLGQFGMIIIFFLLFFPIAGFSLGDFIGTILSFTQRLLLP